MNADDDSIIVQIIIEKIINESKNKAFKSEVEIQGFITGLLNHFSQISNCKIKREVPTTIRYKKKNQNLHTDNLTGRSGYIDFVLEYNENKIGLEIEYPRGLGLKNKEFFISHIKNDILKLENENNLSQKYVLVFLYNDPPFDYKNELENIDFNGVFFLYIRLNKRNEINETGLAKNILILHPKNWMKLRNYQKTVTVKKEHECCFCGRIIGIGGKAVVHHYGKGKYKDDISNYYCKNCYHVNLF